MPSRCLDPDRLGESAFVAADLLACTDAYGRIVDAVGDAALLHHPTADRLLGRNILELISETHAAEMRESLWTIGPGRRLAWDDVGGVEGGRRIVARRNLMEGPGVFSFAVSRTPTSFLIRGDRAEDLLADRFRDAVTNGRLLVARQPIVETRTGRVSHYEMLARFEGEDSPASLIAAAEKTGQISHLDYVMVRAAVARLAMEPDPAFRLSVNISGESIQRMDVTRELAALITGHAFARSRLIVEVTESAQIADLESAARCVNRLRATGVGVALDDFGAGAASFGYLRSFDIDSLKFDGGFLAPHAPTSRSAALMRNIARMCAELGILSVGERVETEADRQILIAAGIRLAQGYLFGRPAIDPKFFAGEHGAHRVAA